MLVCGLQLPDQGDKAEQSMIKEDYVLLIVFRVFLPRATFIVLTIIERSRVFYLNSPLSSQTMKKA